MSGLVITNVIRFFALLLVQGLVLKEFSPGVQSFNYIHVLLYPLFIILLPKRTPNSLVLLFSFFMGLSVDVFYDSPGVHASASVFSGLLRLIVIKNMEPRGGYSTNFIPTKAALGFRWFALYASWVMAGHLLFYFSVEAFNFAYFGTIMLRTVFSFIVSMGFLFAVMFIFNPES